MAGERHALQWVHGPQTVVMDQYGSILPHLRHELQWVHGPQTVVMVPLELRAWAERVASMGPRSSDRGYGQSCQ